MQPMDLLNTVVIQTQRKAYESTWNSEKSIFLLIHTLQVCLGETKTLHQTQHITPPDPSKHLPGGNSWLSETTVYKCPQKSVVLKVQLCSLAPKILLSFSTMSASWLPPLLFVSFVSHMLKSDRSICKKNSLPSFQNQQLAWAVPKPRSFPGLWLIFKSVSALLCIWHFWVPGQCSGMFIP